MSKKIKLSSGDETVVDNDDYSYLSKWKWKLHKDGYAYRSNGKKPNIYLHRVVNKTPKGKITDHINQNKLDNRKSNLRTVVKAQNQRNTKMFCTNTSGFKGVTWNKQQEKWNAYIHKNNKRIHLGNYDDVDKAVNARLLGEKEHWVW